MLHIRARKGSANTARGALRFVEELIPRVDRAGATGEKLLRADSGFWNIKIMTRLQAAGWTYSIGIRQQPQIKAVIAQIPEQDWQILEDYPERSEAQIAETMLGQRRMIVRRTRLVGAQAELWPDWRHHAFLTNRADPVKQVEAEHRGHAVIELAIRDLKDQSASALPVGPVSRQRRVDSDRRARAQPPEIDHPDRPARHDHPDRAHHAPPVLTVAGRITRTARTVTLRMPARWPWETQFLTALERLRAVAPLT